MQELADYLVNKCGRKLAHTQSLYIGILGSAGNGSNDVWHASMLSSRANKTKLMTIQTFPKTLNWSKIT